MYGHYYAWLMFLAEAANCAGVSLRTVLIAMRLENVRIPERQDPFCVLDSQYFGFLLYRLHL
jgi:hypothetical protein